MMAVIVDHAHTRSFATQLEAAIDAAEVRERAANLLDADVQTKPHGDRRRSIQDIVDARNVQTKFTQVPTLISDLEPANRLIILANSSAFDHPDMEIRAPAGSVTDGAAANLRQQTTQMR